MGNLLIVQLRAHALPPLLSAAAVADTFLLVQCSPLQPSCPPALLLVGVLWSSVLGSIPLLPAGPLTYLLTECDDSGAMSLFHVSFLTS